MKGIQVNISRMHTLMHTDTHTLTHTHTHTHRHTHKLTHTCNPSQSGTHESTLCTRGNPGQSLHSWKICSSPNLCPQFTTQQGTYIHVYVTHNFHIICNTSCYLQIMYAHTCRLGTVPVYVYLPCLDMPCHDACSGLGGLQTCTHMHSNFQLPVIFFSCFMFPLSFTLSMHYMFMMIQTNKIL